MIYPLYNNSDLSYLSYVDEFNPTIKYFASTVVSNIFVVESNE